MSTAHFEISVVDDVTNKHVVVDTKDNRASAYGFAQDYSKTHQTQTVVTNQNGQMIIAYFKGCFAWETGL